MKSKLISCIDKIIGPVGVLGFGAEGRSTYSFLKKQGIEAIIFDQNKVCEMDVAKQVTGKKYLNYLNLVKTLFRSAGVCPDQLKIQEFIKQGGILTSQIEFFSEIFYNHFRIIGITGTVGKGSCCTLLTRIIKSSNQNAHLVGNIGKPVLDIVEKVKSKDWVVIELSSFQLSTFHSRFTYAIILETTVEHLNWHVNQLDYWKCKSNLVRQQQKVDNVYFYSHNYGSQKIASLSQAKKNMVNICEDGWLLNGKKYKLKDHQMQAPFFMKNAAMIATVALDIGMNASIITQVILSFQGLPHRLEFCRTYKNISFYNDSNATRIESTIGALNTFTKIPLGLILGGSDKKADFTSLINKISQKNLLIAIALIGETAPVLFDLLHKNKRIKICTTLEVAVSFLMSSIQQGVVLLSPACASFGMFKNYEERGNVFKKIINHL